MIRAPKVAVGGKLPRPRWGLDLLLHPFLPSREEKDVENRDTLAHSFPYINRYSNRATFQVTWVRRRPRHATFWRRCVPAAPSCDILESLRASGPVMRHSGEPACQRPRHAAFWRRCVPAEPSSDFFTPLRASGAVKRLFRAAACQRARQATFWRHLRPSGTVKRLGGERKAEDVGLHAHDPCHNDSAGSFCNGSARGRGQGFGSERSVELP